MGKGGVITTVGFCQTSAIINAWCAYLIVDHALVTQLKINCKCSPDLPPHGLSGFQVFVLCTGDNASHVTIDGL